jgi:hypothetical protein
VTLYVAAPGAAQAEGDADEGHSEVREPGGAAPPLAATAQERSPQVRPRTRRPRKPGGAAGAPQLSETPPAPVPPHSRPSSAARAQDAETDRTRERDYPSPAQTSVPSDGEEPHEEMPDERAGDGFTHEELVAQVDDLFAGRAGAGLAGWRRVYPRPPVSLATSNRRRWGQ